MSEAERPSRSPRLWPWQEQAVAAVGESIARDAHPLVVAPTGCGKTTLFCEVARLEVERGGRVLVLAHRTELIDQAAERFELFGMPTAIEQSSRRVDPDDLPSVVVASVASLRGKRLERFASDSFTLVIIDEAHHGPAGSYRAIADRFEAAARFGVTATPYRSDGQGLGELFSEVAYRLEIWDAIEDRHLCPVQCKQIEIEGLTLSEVQQVRGDFASADLERAMLAAGVAAQAGALLERREGRPTLAFTAGVRHAHDLVAAALLIDPTLRAAAVDGSTSKSDRARIVTSLRRGELDLLANCAVFTEGVDIPNISCVALLRPTRSRSLYAQMVGRGLRVAEGKDDCLVLDFVEVASTLSLACDIVTALGGELLPAPVRDEARRLLKENPELKADEAVRQALDEAEAEAAKQIRRGKAKVRHHAESIDMLTGRPKANKRPKADARPRSGPDSDPTHEQLIVLMRLVHHAERWHPPTAAANVDRPPSRGAAAEAIATLRDVLSPAPAMPYQMRVLRDMGRPYLVTFGEAEAILRGPTR